MIVTQISSITGSRSKVYINDEFAFVLYKGELHHYGITEGGEITPEIVEEIEGTVLTKRAKLRGMALLKSRPYTRKQMYNKLKQGLYPERVIYIAIEYLESFGYIDDVKYAEDYIEYHIDNKSRKCIEQDLLNKGIDKQEISNAFTKCEENGCKIDEIHQIQEWIKKKSYDAKTSDLKEKQKMMAFLFRKGFPVSCIKSVLNCDEFF